MSSRRKSFWGALAAKGWVRAGGICVGILSSPCIRAEFFFDFSLGAAFTNSARVEVEDDTTFPETTDSERTGFDPSPEVAIRFGGWIEPLMWLGFAADFSHFQAEGGPVESNHIFSFSTLFMVRAPILCSGRYPYGRLQPYFGIGPSLVLSDSVVDLRPEVPERINTTAVDLGLDVRAGVGWEFAPHFVLFVEYKFLYFRQTLEETSDFTFFESVDATAETTYTSRAHT